MKPAQKRRSVSIERLQNGALGLLKTQVGMLATAQKDYGGDLDELKKLTDAVGSLNRATASILAEKRKQDVADKKANEQLSAEERAELVLEFLPDLPIEQRARIAERLVELGGGLL